ncbi:MAG: putative metal-binding motif-containing protein [Myxococcota bacterium]
MWIAIWAGCGGAGAPVAAAGIDRDGDGYAVDQDCADDDPEVRPGVVDPPYDGVDQDCSGLDLVDVDRDGFAGAEVGGDDCDDRDPEIHPGAVDVPNDGVDQDCLGGDRVDGDGDGYDQDDCDDRDPLVHPQAQDLVGNAVDDDCDGIDGVDGDRDGVASAESGGFDCRDEDPIAHLGAPEVWYDGIDQACDVGCDFDADGDGRVPAWTPEADRVGPCSSAEDDCDDLDPTAYEIVLSYANPTGGQTEVDPVAPIELDVRTSAPGSSATLTDGSGALVPVDLTEDGRSWVAFPRTSLAGDHWYQFTLGHGCAAQTVSFTTGARRPPHPDPIGVWRLHNDPGTLVLDSALSDLLAAPDLSILFEVREVHAGLVDLRIAGAARLSDGTVVQDVCVPTVDLPDVSFADDPTLRWTAVAPIRFGVIDGSATTTGSATVVATLDAEFASRVRATVDTRSLEVLFDAADWGVADLCAGAASLGEACVPCPDGQPFCLDTEVWWSLSTVRVDTVVVERSEAEIALDPGCP